MFLAGAVVDLLRVRSEVAAGRSGLTTLSVDRLDGDLVATIDAATGHLDRADQIADRSPFLAAIGVAPGAGTQVDGLRTLTEAAADLGASARDAAVAIDADLDDASGDPAARLRLLATLSDELDRVEAHAGTIDLGKGTLVGPLGSARADLQGELDRLPGRFAKARDRVAALERVLRGPTRYLVLAANNAEMRGGGGMPLSGGILTIEDGDLEFGEFESTANRWAGPIDASLIPPEYRHTYQQFRVGQSWLQTAVSPNFPTTGPIFDAMSSAFPTFGPVDGVLTVDTVSLRHLLEAIGPVEVDGFTYDATNVEQRLLNENYLRFGSSEGRPVRQEEQGQVATEIFEALKSRDVAIAPVMTALRDAAAGRHLLAFAEDADVQAMFDELGASGALHPAGLMVTVQNIAANKLDWYIDPTVTVRSVPTPRSDSATVRLTVRIPNPRRVGDTPGVESARSDYLDGIHRSLVGIYLPAAAFEIRSLDRDFSEAGKDPPMWMVGTRVFIEEGQEQRVSIEFKLPPHAAQVTLLPSGRVRPVTVTVNGTVTDDAIARPLSLAAGAGETDRSVGVSGIAALLAAAGAAILVMGHRRSLVRTDRRPLVAASALEQRLPTFGMLLLLAAGAALVAGVLIDQIR